VNIKFLGPDNKDSFQVGDTIIIETTTKTSPPFDDTLTKEDMDSISITIEDKDGNDEVAAVSMTNNSSGEYYYSWNTSSVTAGDYKIIISASDSGSSEEDIEWIRLN